MRDYTKLAPGPTVVQTKNTMCNDELVLPEPRIPKGWVKVRVGYPGLNEWFLSETTGKTRYWDLSQGPAYWGMRVIVAPELLPLPSPPPLRRRVFVETGEVRRPKRGEWYECFGSYYQATKDGAYPYSIWCEETPSPVSSEG
jgi:hypothetical protein